MNQFDFLINVLLSGDYVPGIRGIAGLLLSQFVFGLLNLLGLTFQAAKLLRKNVFQQINIFVFFYFFYLSVL